MLSTRLKEKEQVKQENAKRLAAITQHFDPVTGVGSLVKRVKFRITMRNVVYIPFSMVRDVPWIRLVMSHGSLLMYVQKMCNASGTKFSEELFNEVYAQFIDIRLDHDFEYWAYTTVNIIDKNSGDPIPFKLNLPQRKLVNRFEIRRMAGKPIRVIVCKARQWGGSTVTQIYMAWIQIRIKTNWNSVVIAAVEDQSRNIRGMFTALADSYPENMAYDLNGDVIKKLKLIPFEGSSKTRKIQGRNCLIGISSIEKPENTRSFDYAMCHMSEVGLWKGTVTKSPKDLVQSIRGGIKKGDLSMEVLESTPKGVGNFFHNEWLAAKSERSNYDAFLMPWHGFADYLSEIPEQELDAFIDSMDESDWHRWEQGATLQGIRWYREYMRDNNFDKWRMESEFPGDDIEAFQSTGSPVFHLRYTKLLRDMCTNPVAKGQLSADSMMGSKDVLKNIEFVPSPEGRLWIWEFPDNTVRVKNRYVVSVDIGGTTDEADWSIVRVIDRYWMKEGGNPKAVATWRGHIDQDLLAWIACQIAAWYNNALLVIESNSLRKNEKDPGSDHFLTVLDKIAEVYDNIYTRTTPDKVREGAPVLYGWHTNRSTKPLAVNTLKSKVRDQIYEECDIRLCDEMNSFMLHDDGSMGAVKGMHDDMVMSTAIGLRVSDEMDLPVEIVETYKEKTSNKTKANVSESTF